MTRERGVDGVDDMRDEREQKGRVGCGFGARYVVRASPPLLAFPSNFCLVSYTNHTLAWCFI